MRRTVSISLIYVSQSILSLAACIQITFTMAEQKIFNKVMSFQLIITSKLCTTI